MAEQNEDEGTFAGIITAVDASEVEPDRHLSIQLDRSAREAIRAAKTSGKKAVLTVKLAFQPGPDNRMGIVPTVTTQCPRPPSNNIVMFADADGELYKENPAQLKFPLTSKLHDAAQERE